MKRFTDAIAKALADKNWLAAVALSLTMPDVCGGMEHPNDGSEKRYRAWWDKYMLKHYPRLSSADAYALRCAYLHEGGLHQRARKALTQNHFVVPKEGVLPRRHSARKVRNMVASSRARGKKPRILQADTFCRQIIDALDTWSNDVSKDPAVQKLLQSLLKVHELEVHPRIYAKLSSR
jgi:hypothetical protein